MTPGHPAPDAAVTAPLAKFCAQLSYGQIPQVVRERAHMFVLDAIGIMLGAVAFNRENQAPELERFLKIAASPGPSTALGFGLRTSPMMAAFANGTLSEVLDFQDTDMAARIHNGVTVIPAALAIAEATTGVSGERFLTAIVAGYEVGSRLGALLQPTHWYRGFQATGTIGTTAAAVAASLVLNLDEAGIAAALGASGLIMPVSNSDNVFRGHSIKPVHGGQPAMCGVQAALMAQAGFIAALLEGEPPRYQGVLNMLGPESPRLAPALLGLGEEWQTLRTAFKPYPVGLINIAPVEATLTAMQRHDLQPELIERIDVQTYKDAVVYTGGKYTTSASNHVDCYLSMPYCIAASVMDRALTPAQLTHHRISDPHVHDFARKVVVTEDTDMSQRYPMEFPVRVQFTLRGGKTVEETVDQFRWSPARPPDWDGIEQKFRGLTVPLIGADLASNIINEVRLLESSPDMSGLLNLLANAKVN